MAIVLIDFIEHELSEKLEQKEGLAPIGQRGFSGLTRKAFRDCVVKGTGMRILPITLTTSTTVGGLLPLAFGGDPL